MKKIMKSVILIIAAILGFIGITRVINDLDKNSFTWKNVVINIILMFFVVIWIIWRVIIGFNTYSCDKNVPFNEIDAIRKNKGNVSDNDLLTQQLECINKIYYKGEIDKYIKQDNILILYKRREILAKRLNGAKIRNEIFYGNMISMIAALEYWLVTECGIEGIYIGCGVAIFLSLIIVEMRMAGSWIEYSYILMVYQYELRILDEKIFECQRQV